MTTLGYILKNYKYQKESDRIELANVTREDLAKLLHALDFKKGVEVGVAGGIYSRSLVFHNPQMKLWGVDPYLPYKGYKDYTKDSTFAKLRQEAGVRLAPYSNYEFIPEFSLDAVQRFEDGELDFVYIDANHREDFVTKDIEAWIKKIHPGGILAGDDYAHIKAMSGSMEGRENWAVIPAVNKYVKEHALQLFIWGLQAKDGQFRDPIRSWMVVVS